MNKPVTKLPTSTLQDQIKTIFSGIKTDQSVQTEVSAIARQIAGGDLLEAVDLAQLRDLAKCAQRMLDGAELAAEALTSSPTLWSQLIGRVQSDTGLKRALLRDLSATRAARTAGTKKNSKPDGGIDWEGLL